MTNPNTLKTATTNPATPTSGAQPIRKQADSYPDRFEAVETLPTVAFDEALVVDARSGLTPAQVVENKLSRKLGEASVPVSHLQMRGLLRSR